MDLLARLRRRPLPGDAALAGLVLLFLLVAGSSLPMGMGGNSLMALGYAVPLLWRRSDADVCALMLVPVHVVQLAISHGPQAGNVTVPLALYAVATYGDERWTRPWLAASWVAAALAGVSWTMWPYGRRDLIGFLLSAGSCAAVVSAAWFMGSWRRSVLARAQADSDRADALQREEVQAVRLAATQERQRIAREMHDIVAHSLSIIVVQADGARYVATEAPGAPEDRLARAASAIETIAATARSALAETRRLVGVLHDDEGADLAPASGLTDLPRLVESVVAAGRPATLTVSGDPAWHVPLGQTAELAGYRVVQEALTNVMKHAGPDARVAVTVFHRPEGVTIAVLDDGRGAVANDGHGHGLVGMRERVHALGGTLVAGNSPAGGFAINAFLPAPLAQSPAPEERTA